MPNAWERDPRTPNRHVSPDVISVTPYAPGSKYLRINIGSVGPILNTEGALKLLAQLALTIYQVHTPCKEPQ